MNLLIVRGRGAHSLRVNLRSSPPCGCSSAERGVLAIVKVGHMMKQIVLDLVKYLSGSSKASSACYACCASTEALIAGTCSFCMAFSFDLVATAIANDRPSWPLGQGQAHCLTSALASCGRRGDQILCTALLALCSPC